MGEVARVCKIHLILRMLLNGKPPAAIFWELSALWYGDLVRELSGWLIDGDCGGY